MFRKMRRKKQLLSEESCLEILEKGTSDSLPRDCPKTSGLTLWKLDKIHTGFIIDFAYWKLNKTRVNIGFYKAFVV